MNLTLKVWRQKDARSRGDFVTYAAADIKEDMSFLEMLDVVNEGLVQKGEEPIAFDHDCREGICGTCGFVINGRAHGPRPKTTVCQLHMRTFKDGDTLVARAVARRRLSGRQGPHRRPRRVRPHHRRRRLHLRVHRRRSRRQCHPRPEGERRPRDGRRGVHRLRRVRGRLPERLGHALRLGEGLAPGDSCPRASRSVPHASARWSPRWTQEGFGTCTNHGECEAACPKGIRMQFIAQMNSDFVKASATAGLRPTTGDTGSG